MQRHGPGGRTAAFRIRAAGFLLLGAYLLFVGWLTLRPLAVPWVLPTNTRPFATIRADLADGPTAALTGIGGGLLLMVPLALLLPIAGGGWRRPLPALWLRAVGVTGLLSSGIAVTQSGISGQMGNVDSVLLNTLGVAVLQPLLFPPLRGWLLRGPRRAGTGGRSAGRSGGGAAPRQSGSPEGSSPRTTRVHLTPWPEAGVAHRGYLHK
ncbi:VanZ family protein [Streptomyces sulphureus]|uniref:VanZ family protein n=1 Tax=Streptomyces sulphureus TaxID=47758 RepID=UPI000381A4FA|nr:VanZ family protein [Streptomyces sulphureus]